LQLRASFAPAEINFPAYSRDEISKIITTRVRKALDVCRRAIELSELVPILCYFCSL
jgi:Cdc6-like AAA superfamily ATPase